MTPWIDSLLNLPMNKMRHFQKKNKKIETFACFTTNKQAHQDTLKDWVWAGYLVYAKSFLQLLFGMCALSDQLQATKPSWIYGIAL